MPPFDEAVVSAADLRDIYGWLISLPTLTPTTTATRSPAVATQEARDRFYPALDGATLAAQARNLDEIALRATGEVVAVEAAGRFTQVRLRVGAGRGATTLVGLYDTHVQRHPFPATPGMRVTLYGIGAHPLTDPTTGATTPQMQILHVAAATLPRRAPSATIAGSEK